MTSTSASPAPARRRRQLLTWLAIVVVVGLVLYAIYAVVFGGRSVSTDNAYVGAEVAQVTPLVPGPVAQVPAKETQFVHTGDPLVVLDDADARIAVAQALAALGQAQRKVAGYQASDTALGGQVAARQADLTRAQADLTRARTDLERRQNLAGSGAVSGEELTTAKNAFAQAQAELTQAQANVRAAQGQRQANLVLIQGAPLDQNPEVAAARARLDSAKLALARTVIRAPMDGVVSKKSVQVGQQVQAGSPLMAVVPIAAAYVDANFKEVQLKRVRIGQPVTLTSDLYGGDVVFHGRVTGLSGGTGSAFSLIPAQNASGNWIKVVQRLPVRIALDPKELSDHPLRVGLSMKAKIDISGAASPMANASAQGSGPPPMTGALLAVTSIALALGTFMQVLDTTIANVSLPTIAGNLGVSADQGTWVVTAFAVANGASVPLTGWLMGRYGVVRTFVGSVILFTIASFLCGISWNLPSLIAFRILQGAVSGPMIPGSQALLIMIFPPHKRGTALAIWSMTTLVAPICGPILGGYISDNIAWPWIFLINLPIGAICAFFCWRNLSSRETPTYKNPIDGIGFAMLLVWVGALQVMLDTGKDADWFNSPAIVVEGIVAIIGFIAWLIWELNERYPIVDLSLLKNRNFVLATLVSCLGFAIFFGTNLLQPLWLQTRMGYIATWAGLVAAPSGVVAVFLTPFAARLLNRVDARWTASVSLLAFGASYYLRSLFTSDVDFFALVIPMMVQGIAMATFFVSMITLALNGIPGNQVPAASGLYNFLRITAGSFAASVVTTEWDRSAALHQTRLSEVMGAHDPAFTIALQKLNSMGMTAQQALAAVTNQVGGQAYLLATIDIFRICAILMVLLIPLVWVTSKAMAQGASHPAAD